MTSRNTFRDMAFKQLFKVLFRKMCPAMYATASIFASCETTEKSNVDSRIYWEPPDPSKFTHEYMIKRSTVDTINSVSQALTIAYTAIESTSKEYRQSLSQLMSLTKETLSYNVSDLHWDLIVAARSEMQKKKQAINHFVNYMEYVQRLGVAATEAGYMAGMDNLSLTLCQRMDDALNNMNKEMNHNLLLEQEYIILQQECVKKANAEEALKEIDNDEDLDVDESIKQTRST